jgi:hypothetical protein
MHCEGNRGKTMASGNQPGKDPESTFTYAVRELRQASQLKKRGVDSPPLKATNEHRGFDPYNTSGTFDHKRNWMRIGKR